MKIPQVKDIKLNYAVKRQRVNRLLTGRMACTEQLKMI